MALFGKREIVFKTVGDKPRWQGAKEALKTAGIKIMEAGSHESEEPICSCGAKIDRRNYGPYGWIDRRTYYIAVQDVIVEHPVYGQLTAPLQLSSRYDVDQFIRSMASSDARPLSALTEGIHLHTLSCPSDDALHHLREKLRAMGVLLEEQD